MLIGTSSSFSKVRFRTTLLKSLRRRADRDSSSVLEMVLSFTRIQWDFVLSDDVTLSTFSSLMTISLLFFEFFLRLWRFPASSNALTAWTFRLTWPWRDTPAPILNRILSTTLSCEKTSDLRFLLLLIYPLLREFEKKRLKNIHLLTQDWTLQAIDSSTTTCSVYMPLSKAGDFQFKAIDLIGLNSTQIFCRRE